MRDLSEYKAKPLDRDSQILLEQIDTNCNTCMYFMRDLEWAKAMREKLGRGSLSHARGGCCLKGEFVKPGNGTCMPENGITATNCWESRRTKE